MTTPYPRIAARKGGVVRLNVSFFANGVPTDPFAIRLINIYKGSKAESNLVEQINVVDPDDPSYPFPLVKVEDSNSPEPGVYYYDLTVSDTYDAPEVYIDDWSFIGDDMVGGSGTSVDVTDESLWDTQCSKFWVVRSQTWYMDDGLIVPRFGFTQLDKNLTKPENRTIEVALVPLPLYEYDYNRIAPLMPQLQATITVTTENAEMLIDSAPMTIGLRQGKFRDTPFVARYKFDTSAFLIGSYRYWVRLQLPNGETRSSPVFVISVN